MMIRTIQQFIQLRKGQSVIEYAVFISVVVLALLAMQVYMKRGLQGKMKDMADQISPDLYNPNLSESNFSTNSSSYVETSFERGVLKRNVVLETTNRTGIEYVYPETHYE